MCVLLCCVVSYALHDTFGQFRCIYLILRLFYINYQLSIIVVYFILIKNLKCIFFVFCSMKSGKMPWHEYGVCCREHMLNGVPIYKVHEIEFLSIRNQPKKKWIMGWTRLFCLAMLAIFWLIQDIQKMGIGYPLRHMDMI